MKPKWIDYFLGLTKIIARRSTDSQTQHGCVIVSDKKKILSTGCNGHPRDMNEDERIPNTREKGEGYKADGKYPWMLHAEDNALANRTDDLEGATAYISGPSCFHCMIRLWQSGIRHIVQKAGYGWKADNDPLELALKAEFYRQTDGKLKIENINPSLRWLAEMMYKDSELWEALVKYLKEEHGLSLILANDMKATIELAEKNSSSNDGV